MPGTRSMSPKEQKITSGREAMAMGPVDHLQRRHADRAARPVDQFDLGGKQLVDAVLDDRVRLPAADLHDRPGPGGRPTIACRSCAAASGSRYSSRYFTMLSFDSFRLSHFPRWQVVLQPYPLADSSAVKSSS